MYGKEDIITGGIFYQDTVGDEKGQADPPGEKTRFLRFSTYIRSLS